ncbi:MAG: hypothetical protein R6V53_04680 [Candidatus Woesearchaeota archaeon]
MATPLDIGLLDHFEIIFPFLFILVFGYAILTKLKPFGDDNKGIYAVIAFVLAVMTIFSPIVRETFVTAAPWFVLLFIFLIFTVIAYMALGASEDDIVNVLKSSENRFINLWVFALILIIALGSLTTVLSRHGGVGTTPTEDLNMTEAEASEQESEFWSTLVHPKVLGMVLILLVSFFTIQRLTKE